MICPGFLKNCNYLFFKICLPASKKVYPLKIEFRISTENVVPLDLQVQKRFFEKNESQRLHSYRYLTVFIAITKISA